MNKKNVVLAGLVSLGSLGSVQAAEMANQTESAFKSSVELSQGYRRDSLNLKTGHHDKQHFKHLDTWTTRVGYNAMKDDLFFRGVVGYGDIYDGRVHTHNGHNSHKVNGDYTWDFSAMFGKRFSYDNGWFVAPMVGYGVYYQDLTKKHHHHDRTKALWYSPQFGICVMKNFSDNLSGYLEYTLLYPMNLQIKKSHHHGHNRTHENKAYKSVGNLGTVGVNWMFASNWSLRPEIEVMEFYSNSGDSSHHNHNKRAHRASIEYRLVLNYAF